MDSKNIPSNPSKIILIVSSERSGSTTLQRLLNTIPESNVTGENNNAIVDLLKAFKSLKELEKKRYNSHKTINEYIEKSGWKQFLEIFIIIYKYF